MRKVCDVRERFLPAGSEGLQYCPVCGAHPFDFEDSRTIVPGDRALGDKGELGYLSGVFGPASFELGGCITSFRCRNGCHFAQVVSWTNKGTKMAWFADGEPLLPRVSASYKQVGCIKAHCRDNGLPLPWASFPCPHPEQFYDIEDAKNYIAALKAGDPLPVGGKSRAFALYPSLPDKHEEPATKECAKCGRDLPLSEFNEAHGSADGLMRVCRVCEAENNALAEQRRRAEAEEAARRQAAEAAAELERINAEKAAAAERRAEQEANRKRIEDERKRAAAEASLPAMPKKPDSMRPATTGAPKPAAVAAGAPSKPAPEPSKPAKRVEPAGHPLGSVVSKMALSSETKSALAASGIDTLEALSALTRSQAAKKLHLGPGTVRRLSVEMARIGLSFAS